VRKKINNPITLKFKAMDFDTIFQSQKAFFNTHQTKDITFRKETLKSLKPF
jgi:hypothetical protein